MKKAPPAKNFDWWGRPRERSPFQRETETGERLERPLAISRETDSRDSIKSKAFEEEGWGFGEGRRNLEKGEPPTFLLPLPQVLLHPPSFPGHIAPHGFNVDVDHAAMMLLRAMMRPVQAAGTALKGNLKNLGGIAAREKAELTHRRPKQSRNRYAAPMQDASGRSHWKRNSSTCADRRPARQRQGAGQVVQERIALEF